MNRRTIAARLRTSSNAYPKRLRSGFTLVELLVVITIMSILIGLLMPAVNNAREAGRQAQCQANIKQLAVAVQAYATKEKSLPYGTFADSKQTGAESWEGIEYKGSTAHLILPFIGMETMYKLLRWKEKDMNRYIGDKVPGTDTPIYAFRIPSFVCPSDDYRGLSPSNRALGCYVGCAGPKQVNATGRPSCSCPLGATYNKLYSEMSLGRLTNEASRRTYPTPSCFMSHFSVKNDPIVRTVNQIYPAVSLAQIRDGDSCTILMAETRPRCTAESLAGWANTWNGNGILSTLVPINYDSCNEGTDFCKENGCSVNRNWNTQMGYKSAHPGGAYFAMVDTSVHFITEGIDMRLYQLLGAIDDGKPARVP